MHAVLCFAVVAKGLLRHMDLFGVMDLGLRSNDILKRHRGLSIWSPRQLSLCQFYLGLWTTFKNRQFWDYFACSNTWSSSEWDIVYTIQWLSICKAVFLKCFLVLMGLHSFSVITYSCFLGIKASLGKEWAREHCGRHRLPRQHSEGALCTPAFWRLSPGLPKDSAPQGSEPVYQVLAYIPPSPSGIEWHISYTLFCLF